MTALEWILLVMSTCAGFGAGFMVGFELGREDQSQ